MIWLEKVGVASIVESHPRWFGHVKEDQHQIIKKDLGLNGLSLNMIHGRILHRVIWSM
jgi:hypothetical protein